MSEYRHPERFLGLDDDASDRERSAAWVLPVPLEMTTSYVGGTRLGPAAIIEASQQVELYDSMLGIEAAPKYGVHTLPRLHPTLASPAEAVDSIAQAVAALPLDDRLLVTLGGEHSLTPGVVRTLAARYPDLVIVQIDAHADLRDSFEGSPYSHACAMRRCLEYAPVFGFGIRSMCAEEVEFARGSERVTLWQADEMHADRERNYLTALRLAVAGRPIYLTIDCDGLDPSVIPAVGTPEPGGMGWYDTLDLIKAVSQSGNVVALDCVELCPAAGAQASAFAAAKLVYRAMNVVMVQGGKV